MKNKKPKKKKKGDLKKKRKSLNKQKKNKKLKKKKSDEGVSLWTLMQKTFLLLSVRWWKIKKTLLVTFQKYRMTNNPMQHHKTIVQLTQCMIQH